MDEMHIAQPPIIKSAVNDITLNKFYAFTLGGPRA
jgi:hypothetical protein